MLYLRQVRSNLLTVLNDSRPRMMTAAGLHESFYFSTIMLDLAVSDIEPPGQQTLPIGGVSGENVLLACTMVGLPTVPRSTTLTVTPSIPARPVA